MSIDPWDNLSRGLDSDRPLYDIAKGFYQLMESLAVSGVLASFLLIIMMAFLLRKKREEIKDRLIFIMVVVILICITPGLLTLAARVAAMFQ